MGDIAAKIGLPGDDIFNGARLLVKVTGFVIGTVRGLPMLTNACVKSLIKDVLAKVVVRAVCKVISEAIGSTLKPVHRETRPLAANELGPDGAQASQVRSDLADASQRLELETAERAAARRGLPTAMGPLA